MGQAGSGGRVACMGQAVSVGWRARVRLVVEGGMW